MKKDFFNKSKQILLLYLLIANKIKNTNIIPRAKPKTPPKIILIYNNLNCLIILLKIKFNKILIMKKKIIMIKIIK